VKITIVTGAFFPVPPIMGGAVEKVWFSLGQEFARRGHEVVHVSRAHADLPSREHLGGVTHVRVEGFDQPRSIVWLKFLDLIYSLRVLRNLPQADMTVTNTFWLPILRKGVYVHVARYPKGQMRLYARAARLQAPSRTVGQTISNQAPKLGGKVKVIPYPAPRSTSTSEPPPISQRDKIILYVGRIHPEKGVHFLVEAFAREARTVFAEWTLMIVGPAETKLGGGAEEYLASLQRPLDNIVFAGAIFDRAALEQKYRAARLFVYPSVAEHGESFGLAPLEAMTHGCAVLVSDLSCFRDFVQDNETGFVFNRRSSDVARDLSDKMEKAIVDLDTLSRVAEAGWRKAQEYSLEHVADQFLADFEQLQPSPPNE
jgi:glycosyltransferase involved in cell wall biosynthesis